MLRPNISEVDISSWFGSLQRLNAYSIPLTNSLLDVNCQFLHGQIGSRYGTSVPLDGDGQPFIQADGQITAFINWLFTFSGVASNTITYYCPSIGIKGWQQSGAGFTSTLIPVTGAAGASMAVSGERLYAAFYDTTGKLGTNIGYVYGWDIGADQLFAPPISNPIAAVDVAPLSGPGLITAGVHNIGYLYTTRNGFTGPICPATPSSPIANFTPLVHTAGGGQALQLTISGSLPSYLVGGTTNVFQIVMTTVANPGQYFAVPGAIAPCFNPTVITINISDEILAQTGTDVTAYMNILTAQASGTGPVSPVSLGTYSARMGYCGIDLDGFPVVYFSDPNDYQHITADQHGIYLDGFQQPVAHYTINGVDYIATVNSHFSVEDNGDVPVTWIPPQKIDGSIGVPSPTCVAVNPSLGYALIASERGFYIFQGGVFPALPVSYYQAPDWNRINWNHPTSIQVVDDPLNKKWSVLAPLNDTVVSVTGSGPYTITTQNHCSLYQSGLSVTFTGISTPQTITIVGYNQFTVASYAPDVNATIYPQSPTHVLTWDYTEGDTPETIKYSLNSNVGYLTGATAQVLNGLTNLTEVWYAPNTAGAFLRRCDGTEQFPNRDIATNGTTPVAITSWNEGPLVPGAQDGTQVAVPSTKHNFYGLHMRVLGQGGLNMEYYGLDSVITGTPAASPLTLSPTPGQEILVRWFLRSPQQSFGCGTNTLDSWWVLALCRFYYSEAMPQGAN
jgi:hypothetical protein